jgi:hypothetical protein
MSCNMISCSECDCLFEEAHYDQKCPVCELKKEMQEKIDNLEELIRNFHPLE